MRISDEKIRDICNHYGTPLYLYDGNFLHEHYHNIRQQLHDQIDIFLSLKANNNLALIQQFAHWGSGVEVASAGELLLAQKAGFKTNQIIFSGPGKRPEELIEAIKEGIYCIIVESIDEAILIDGLAKSKGRQVFIGLRINPDLDMAHTSIKMAGVPRQFGLDESKIQDFFETFITLENVRFRGIHLYMGTQQLNAERILASFTHTIKLAIEIEEQYGCTCEMIDMGGGFGVPYFNHETALDFDSLLHRVNEMVENVLPLFPNTRFIIESGRYLLAQSAAYMSQIIYVKESKGEKFLITDGGMNHHAAATFRGRAMRNNYPVKLIPQDGIGIRKPEQVNIVGPLCTPDDLLATHIELPTASTGDYIAILNSGAYGMTYSPILFLGHETPKEIMIYKDDLFVIRDAGNKEDLLRHQRELDIVLGGLHVR
ncbi:type III PLP-dependent enzyme [Paenibacillus melissococcoides]|uniref:Type III PLP-dependent enzyme n=1 Tax=Paenibacillus melissococcoides TaxID=2912268 RepID=A0ABM9GBJ6_9BACL|nr:MULTISPECIES: type III PLP-dependent enzyme [Paenibacillus]GIO79015.1 diaminopimelate decarboxylase [Paenibacillus dendritiformis]CAH8249540.1 type III PLP-dependent enzyme [Paenibacillus melissococcoides]CAH8721109.1 type III PLP-dependent enzyme [Paenibacillus melissococcoides]